MPALPWTSRSAPEPDRRYVVMATRLRVARFRDVPAFLRGSAAIRRQLAQTDGLIGFALDAKLFARTFWTLSVWRDEQALSAFTRTAPHVDVARSTRPTVRSSTFATWVEPGSAVPVPWERARRRVADSAAQA